MEVSPANGGPTGLSDSVENLPAAKELTTGISRSTENGARALPKSSGLV